MYRITIEPALNGWLVQVGCQTLVSNDVEQLLTELRAYLTDPKGTERRYREEAINARVTLGSDRAMRGGEHILEWHMGVDMGRPTPFSEEVYIPQDRLGRLLGRPVRLGDRESIMPSDDDPRIYRRPLRPGDIPPGVLAAAEAEIEQVRNEIEGNIIADATAAIIADIRELQAEADRRRPDFTQKHAQTDLIRLDDDTDLTGD